MLHILLDSYPLGALSHPTPDVGIVKWAAACLTAGHQIYAPEVIDYEVRRELLRARKYSGVITPHGLKPDGFLGFFQPTHCYPSASCKMLMAALVSLSKEAEQFGQKCQRSLNFFLARYPQA